jgi:hypothetical protein
MVECRPEDEFIYDIVRRYRIFLSEYLILPKILQDYRARPNKAPREFYRAFFSLLTRNEKIVFSEKKAEDEFREVVRQKIDLLFS